MGKAQVFPTTEDPEAENDVDSAQALVMLSGGTSTVLSLGRFYEGGDIVSVELFGSKGHTRFDVVSPETGEGPQLHALRLQAEAFARQVRGAAPEGTTAEEAARVLEQAHTADRGRRHRGARGVLNIALDPGRGQEVPCRTATRSARSPSSPG